MTAPSEPDRRTFLAVAAGAVATTATASPPHRPAPARRSASGVALGVASYSLRNFSPTYLIGALHELGVSTVNLKSFHQPYDRSPTRLAARRAEFEAAGIRIVGGGTITLQQDDDEDIRSYFEYARHSGMPLMVIAPTRRTLPRIERFVQEYGIAVAVHNHGPEDEHFPGPQDVLPVIRDMDPRVGLCVDIGHTVRTGIDVVEALAMAGDRVLDIHMKDLADLRDRDSQCVVGRGAVPVGPLFAQLEAMDYAGHVNLEYEIDAADPLPGMERSFAYMRGVLAGLNT